jgi:hypothetical protein
MKHHLSLMHPETSKELSINERVGAAMADLVENSVKRNGLYESVTSTHEKTDRILKRVGG